EEVLFNTLAQILQKELKEAYKKKSETHQAFEVIPSEEKVAKIDGQHELEKKILELLLLYGNVETDFEDLIIETDEQGEIVYKTVFNTTRVFEKILVELQEDEMEFADASFKRLFEEIMSRFEQNPQVRAEDFINELNPEMAALASNFIMEDERYVLSDWERKDIYVKKKESTISQMVSETILSLRKNLITQTIDELSEGLKQGAAS